MYYQLEDKTIVPVDTITEGLWENRRIDETIIKLKPFGKGSKMLRKMNKLRSLNHVKVSTVFLVIDHGWDSTIPVLFETMIFGGKHDEYQRRYCTYDEAVAGHNKTVLKALEHVINPKL